MNAAKCASEFQVLTASTGPVRCRHNVAAAERAPSVSSASRMTKTAASERNQFKIHQATHTSAASGRKRKKAKPGCGLEAGKARRARIEGAFQAKNCSHAGAGRRKIDFNQGKKGMGGAGATSPGEFVGAAP